MRLLLRAAAERDLDDAFDYGVARYGAALAESYVRDVQAAAERLIDYPALGAETGLRAGLRSLSAREHRIYYRVEDERVLIVRVLHKRMDAGRHV